MAFSYNREAFNDDLSQIDKFLDQIVATGVQIKEDIDFALTRARLEGEVLFVGSTNPQRLTCVIDPKSPDQRYPCDYDTAIILKYKLEGAAAIGLLKDAFLGGQINRVGNTVETKGYRNKFPVAARVLSKAEADLSLPVQYALRFGNLTEEQKRTSRALRLFTMRNGLYGGFTRGFKGVVLEQLAIRYASFEEVLRSMQDELERTNKIDVRDPVNGKDIGGRISADIRKRALDAARIYNSRGLIKATPYTIESWQEEHPESLTLTLGTPCKDAHECYREAKDCVEKSLNTIGVRGEKDYAVLVIPHYGQQETLLAVNNLSKDLRSNFQEELMKRWDGLNGHPPSCAEH